MASEQQINPSGEELKAILDKIALLKTMEAQKESPEEAAIAAAKIQRLMYRYNLDQAQVDAAQRGAAGAYGRVFIDVGSVAPWRRTLLTGICQYNFVKPVFSGVMNATVSLVGQKHNIQSVIGLFDYLQSTIERLAQEEFEDTPIPVRGSRTHFTFMFGEGATSSVIERLRHQWIESMVTGNDQTALAVIDSDLQAAFEDFYPDLTTFDQDLVFDYLAHNKGYEAGKNISLAKQVKE